MQPEPTPSKPATPPPAVVPAAPVAQPVPAPLVMPTPEPAPQHMAVTPAPALDGGIALPPDLPAEHSDHPEHTPEPLTPEDAKPKPTSPKPSTPPPVAPAGPHAPVGIIVATVIFMLLLCGLAVAIYMTSNSSSMSM